MILQCLFCNVPAETKENSYSMEYTCWYCSKLYWHINSEYAILSIICDNFTFRFHFDKDINTLFIDDDHNIYFQINFFYPDLSDLDTLYNILKSKTNMIKIFQ